MVMRPGDRQFTQQQGQPAQKREDELLLVDNYGGLNTTSPSVNTPYSDTPDMVNMDIDVSGILRKRLGSYARNTFSSDPRGFINIPYTLENGDVVMLVKSGTSLAFYYLPDKDTLGEMTEIHTFTNVWTSDAAEVRPDFAWTSGLTDRCIMTTGVNAPVDANISQTLAVGDGTTSVDITRDLSYLDASYTYALYDGNVVNVSGLSQSGATMTVTLASAIPSGTEFILLGVSWQWWAASMKRTKDQCYSSFFRFNTSVEADANVAVPDDIQTGLSSDTSLYRQLGNTGLAFGNFLCTVYQDVVQSATAFTFDNTPTAATEYGWSSLVYTDGSDTIVPGTGYLTFGAISGAGTDPPTPVHFVRRFLLSPMYGNNNVIASDLYVFDSDAVAWTQEATGTRFAMTASTKKWWGVEPDYTVSTSTSDDIAAIAFEGSYPFGIDTAFIEITHTDATYVGSSASSSVRATFGTPGSFFPAYGLGEFCDYYTGEFPTTVTVYQDRVVLAGFRSQPLTLVMSNVNTEGSINRYQNFEILFEDQTISTNPISVTIDGRQDDAIVGMTAWYDSLFVFTKRSVRRVYGSSSVSVSPTNITQTVISEVGCRSKNGIVATDTSILYVSDSGLYAINTTDTSGGFDAVNVGVKVEDIFFKNAENVPQVTWLYYNQQRDIVVMGLSSEEDSYLCSRVLVFFNRRQAFSEYVLYNGYFYSSFGSSDSRRDFITHVVRDTAVTAEPTSSSINVVCEFNIDDLNTDLTYSPTSSQLNSGSTTYAFAPRIEHTVDSNQRIINTKPSAQSGTATRQGFRQLPLSNFYDHMNVVYDNGTFDTTLVGGTDYLRYPFQESIYVNIIPYADSATIEIDLYDEYGNVPVVVTEDTVVLTQGTEYTVARDSGRTEVTKTDGDSDSVYYVGSSIPAWHFTPTLLSELPIQFKRGIHYLGYYDNRIMHSLYTASDANSTASQDAGEVADRYKTESGVSIGILYNDARSGETQLELYGTEDLTWDVSLFDSPSEGYRNQLNDVVRLVEPIIGIGYSIQVCNFNFGYERFALIGYKVKTRLKGKNTTRWY